MAEIENGNGKDWTHEDHQNALNKVRSAASVSMSPELFEKLYLGPQTAVKGDLRKTFGNPTGIAIAGFILCLTPLSCMLMGWRGTQTDGAIGASSIPVYFFQGGVLMNIGGFMELILGNTFPCTVFMTFGTFWLSFGGILNPSFAAWSSYAGTKPEAAGLNTVGFNSSLGFWLLFMGLLCLVYLIGSLRTNICFVLVFLTLVFAFSILTAAYWLIALDAQSGTLTYATRIPKLLKAAGALLFVTAMLGWWIFLALILASVDFPISIPLGDLSGLIKGVNDRKK